MFIATKNKENSCRVTWLEQILKFQKIRPSLFFGCKNGCKSHNYLIYTLYCGERGIRTPGTSQYNGFQDRRDRPLCHLSKTSCREVLSFKSDAKVQLIFESASFSCENFCLRLFFLLKQLLTLFNNYSIFRMY